MIGFLAIATMDTHWGWSVASTAEPSPASTRPFADLALDDVAGADLARARLYEVVHSGDALAISEIGQKLARSRDPARLGPGLAGDVPASVGAACTPRPQVEHWA